MVTPPASVTKAAQGSLLKRLFDGVHAALPSWLGGQCDDADAWWQAACQLQQAHEALLQAGRTAPARLVLAMKLAVRRVAAEPMLRTTAHATLIQQAGVALRSYLDHTTASCPEDAGTLFPLYQRVATLAQLPCTPADLWSCQPWQWLPLPPQGGDADIDLYDAALVFFRLQQGNLLLQAAHWQAQQAGYHDVWRAGWQLLAAALELHAVGATGWTPMLQHAVAGAIGSHTLLQQGMSAEARWQAMAQDCLYLVAQGVQQPSAADARWALAVATRHGVLTLSPIPPAEPASAEASDTAMGIPVLAPSAPRLDESALLQASHDVLQLLHPVLRQWQARPDNPGAGSECTRLLQQLRQLAQAAHAADLLPLVQAALCEAALQRARSQDGAQRLDGLLRAVAAVEAGLQMRRHAA